MLYFNANCHECEIKVLHLMDLLLRLLRPNYAELNWDCEVLFNLRVSLPFLNL